jgi:hypothetical protein
MLGKRASFTWRSVRFTIWWANLPILTKSSACEAQECGLGRSTWNPVFAIADRTHKFAVRGTKNSGLYLIYDRMF